MDLFYFFLRYTPFWAIPIFLICAEFAYLYWLKSFRKISLSFGFIAFICAVFTIYYVVIGGPDNAVAFMSNLLR